MLIGLYSIYLGEGNGTPLQYSCLENPWTEEPGELQSMGSLRVRHDWATSLSLFTFHFPALEKEMATHSSVLAWRIPGMGEPVGCRYGVAQNRTRLKRLSSSSSSSIIYQPEVTGFYGMAYWRFSSNFHCQLGENTMRRWGSDIQDECTLGSRDHYMMLSLP